MENTGVVLGYAGKTQLIGCLRALFTGCILSARQRAVETKRERWLLSTRVLLATRVLVRLAGDDTYLYVAKVERQPDKGSG